MITTVIFDYGCVLSMAPQDEDFEPLRKAIGAEAAVFQEAYWKHRDAYDLDTVNVTAYFQEMGRTAGLTLTPERIESLVMLDGRIWGTPNRLMVEWVRVLRDRGLKTAILSNMPISVGKYLRRELKWLELFNCLCFSGDVKMGKPDPAFYRSCLESLGVTAAESLFIDDREVNIRGAEAVGIRGLLFRSAQELVPVLAPFGLADSLREVIATHHL